MLIRDNKEIYKDNKYKINYIDIGARGDIASPWIEMENNVYVVGFEPDRDECIRLQNKYTNRKYYNIALWSSKTEKEVYINEWESTSSMYRPNLEDIERFQKKHWLGRKIKKTINVQCDTLDNVLSDDGIVPDYIKIDTQGSEYEILKGAAGILKKYTPIITTEVWCYEVYKNAPKIHDVLKLMDDYGYVPFEMELAAAWKHRNSKDIDINSRQKVIGYEIMFVKKQFNELEIEMDAYVKHLYLLELYGYRDYAISLLENNSWLNTDLKSSLLDRMYDNDRKEKNIYYKIKGKLYTKIFGFHRYPIIKY